MGTNNDNPNATYETPDAQIKLLEERSVENECGGVNELNVHAMLLLVVKGNDVLS